MKEFSKLNKSLFLRFVLKVQSSGSQEVVQWNVFFLVYPELQRSAPCIASDCFLACEGKTFIWWWGHWDEVKALEILDCTL